MRYVIIGGSGFVGKELGKLLLQRGEEIINLDLIPSGIPVQDVQQDITREIRFQFRPDDIVVHLAANQYHHKVPKKNRQAFFEEVNVAGTQNILKKISEDGAHQMVFSARIWFTVNLSICRWIRSTCRIHLDITERAKKQPRPFVRNTGKRG